MFIVLGRSRFLSKRKTHACPICDVVLMCDGPRDVVSTVPLATPDRRVDVHLCKHFRYAYQNEFRFVWLPDELQRDLPTVFLELGRLKEFCEIIEI